MGRSLTLVVVTCVVTMVLLRDMVNAQEVPTPHRLTADVFAEASFPPEIVMAARMADVIAAQTQKNRLKVRAHLEYVESIYDRGALCLSPRIPLELFVQLYEEYGKALQELWNVDKELIAADDRVASLYSLWTLEGVDGKSAQVYQGWYDAAHADYVSEREESEEAWLMLNVGYDRIMAEYQSRMGKARESKS